MLEKKQYDKLKQEFGTSASWAIWQMPGVSPKSNMEDVSMFDNESILDRLNPAVVFVGLNPSGVHDGFMDESRPWCFFHSSNPRGHDYKLRYALINTDFWGGYITDLIKDVLEVDSDKLDDHLKKHPEIIAANVKTFLYELSLLHKDPLIVALGDRVYNYLVRFIGAGYRIIKIKHYSYRIGKEDYRRDALKALCKYSLSPDGSFVSNKNDTVALKASSHQIDDNASLSVPAYKGPFIERKPTATKLSMEDIEEIKMIDEEEFGNRRKGVDRRVYLLRRDAYEWANQMIGEEKIICVSNPCGQRQSIVTPGLASIIPKVEGHNGIQRTGYYCVYEIEIREKRITVRFVVAVIDEVPESTMKKVEDVILPAMETGFRPDGKFYTKNLNSMAIDNSTSKETIESFLNGTMESIKQFESRLFSVERMTWHAGDTTLFCNGKKGRFINGKFVETTD